MIINKNKSHLDSYVKQLALNPDQEDVEIHRLNCSPELITRRLRQLVPLLEFVDCEISEVGPERTVLTLPLLESAMNQNGTHQASIFYLVADYTLGVGMFAVLPGVYVTGVHDCCHALPVQYWLKRGFVKHIAPGTGSLSAEVKISSEEALDIRRQLIVNGRCELSGIVHIYQNGNLVAEVQHTMGLYANLPRREGEKANIFQVQNLKTAALMIAGLREDPLSRLLAKGQGYAIAQRMSKAIPQLPLLVKARSTHIEHFLQANAHKFGQVLVLGVNLDPKPVAYANSKQKWFGVDLRDMLRERSEQLNRIKITEDFLTPVIADIRYNTWDRAIQLAGFSSHVPTLVIVEGLLMYISRSELTQMLLKLHDLNSSSDTRIWFDHFTSGMFASDDAEIRSFIASMSRLIEPFAPGFDDPAALLPDAWATNESVAAVDVLDISGPVYLEYRFTVLQPVLAEKEAT